MGVFKIGNLVGVLTMKSWMNRTIKHKQMNSSHMVFKEFSTECQLKSDRMKVIKFYSEIGDCTMYIQTLLIKINLIFENKKRLTIFAS